MKPFAAAPPAAPTVLATLAALAACLPTLASAATPQQVAQGYAASAGAAASPARGQRLFTTTHGREWSCASCHGEVPVAAGRHARTGKSIEPLAPAANPARLTDPARVEKWLRRNCNDVLGRECSNQEKADVTAWLTGIKP
jgi:mono/diheme cytochrome c family protein